VAGFLGLLVVAFLAWPGPTFATVILLVPAAALLFPILDSGRLRSRALWRSLVAYGLVGYATASAVVLVWFPGLFPLLLLFPFFAALLVLVRESIPVPEP